MNPQTLAAAWTAAFCAGAACALAIALIAGALHYWDEEQRLARRVRRNSYSRRRRQWH